jgi:GT2 family glycosyltransferase
MSIPSDASPDVVETHLWGEPVAPAPDDGLRPGCAVAICTYERPESLVRCLESVAGQDRRPDQVLIVDASHGAASVEAVSSWPGISTVAGSVALFRVGDRLRGLTKQRNFALARASYDLIAFFDDDLVLAPACLRELESVHRTRPEAVGVAAVIENQAGSQRMIWRVRRLLGLVPDLKPGRYVRSGFSTPWGLRRPEEGIIEGDWLGGGLTMWRTAPARSVGFNEEFSGYAQGEDLEFSRRACARGRLFTACRARVVDAHEGGGRPDHFRLGYMAIYNRYRIHRMLPKRRFRDVAWFVYAWTVDTMLMARYVVVPDLWGATWNEVLGRMKAGWDLLRGR